MIALDSTFRATVRRYADRPALRSRACDDSLTFAELDRTVTATAAWLDAAPAGPVALAVASRRHLVRLVLAAWRSGRAVVLLDPTSEIDELRRWAPRLGARLLLHDTLEHATSAQPNALRDPDRGGDPEIEEVDPIVELPPTAALVKVTSGSTGEPTGAVLDAPSLLAGIAHIGDGMGITAADQVVVPLPLSHSYGFDNGVLSLLALGTPLVLESSLYASALLDTLPLLGGTVLLLVPPLVRVLANLEWPTNHPLRMAICAGGPLDPEFGAAFRRASRVPVSQFYGSTETGGISFESAPTEADALGTVGSPLPGVTVELDHDQRVRVSSAANAIALISGAKVSPITTSIATGDTAEWTASGRLRLTGRVAGLLNVAGRRIQASGLEQALLRLPGVLEVAVVGLPESVRGDRIVVFVVTTGQRLAARTLPPGVRPREVRYVDALPYTERGKLDRRRLVELARAAVDAGSRGREE